MLQSWQFKLLTVLGMAAFLLALTSAVLFTLNRADQDEINRRQQYVQQSLALEGLYREIIKALAELATKNHDAALLQMLAAQGINVSVNGPGAGAVAAAPAAAKR